jgi:hypothetical protein
MLAILPTHPLFLLTDFHSMNISGRNRLTVLAAIGGVLLASGCKQQDTTVEALRQENAALRKQAQEKAQNDSLMSGQDSGPIGSLQGGTGMPPNGAPPAGQPGAAPGSVPGAAQTTAGGAPGAPRGSAPGTGAADPTSGVGGISHGSLPDYPGSAPDIKGRIAGHNDQTSNGMTLRMLIAPAGMDEVLKFYDDKLTRYIEDPVHPGTWIYRHPSRTERGTGEARQVRLSDAQPDGSVRAVVVRADSGKTYIELMEIASNVKGIPNGVGGAPAGAAPPPSGSSDPLAPPPLVPNKSGGQ